MGKARAAEEAGTQKPLKDIEAFLEEQLLRLPPEAPRSERGAPRVVPAMLLWIGLLVCVLRGARSHQTLWRLLSIHGLWSYRFEVTSEAIRKRREEAGTGPLERLFAQITAVLSARVAPYAERLAPFASMVVALDETTLDPVARRTLELRSVPKGDSALLPGNMCGLFDVRKQLWHKVEHVGNPDQNEKVHARAMVADLPRGSLILADLGYFAFEWFDHLRAMGHHWVSRLRHRTSYEVLHVFYEKGETLDALVWLGKYRADRCRHAVRLVRFRVGAQLFEYVTSVTDPHVLPLAEIARLYARRWDFEMAVKLVKRELGLHLLWSSKLTLVLQQVWAVLILAQILQALRKEVAGQAGVDVFDVSMPLLVEMFPRFLADGLDPVEQFVRHGRFGGMIRPSRRVKLILPEIDPEEIAPLSSAIPLERKPRYAHKIGKGGPRKRSRRKAN